MAQPTNRRKVLVVFGTRPEAIKMAPVVHALRAAPGLDCRVAVTAQHREMLDQVLRLFAIVPDHDLDLMRERQALPELTGRVLSGFSRVLAEEKPDLVLVHGDTTTTMACALAAFYAQIPVGHVEAGLRTDDLYNPFPEEMNRRVTSQLTRLYFAPTPLARENLRREGFPLDRVYVTGNTVIDALLLTKARLGEAPPTTPWGALDFAGQRVVLVTAHRRENWGEPMRGIAAAIARVARDFPDVHVLFPVHRNPIVREAVEPALAGQPRVTLIEPIEYAELVWAMARSHLVLTDSGGLQEEGPALGKPVLVMRTTTERPEAIEAGTARLVGVQGEDIYAEVAKLLTDAEAYRRMSQAVNPYGDGLAAPRIRAAIEAFFGLPPSHAPFQEFVAAASARK